MEEFGGEGIVKDTKEPKKRFAKLKEFKEKVGDWFYYNWDKLVVSVVIGAVVAGLAHHAVYGLHRMASRQRSIGRIEHSISVQENGVSNFAMDDFSVSEKDGKKLLNIFGNIQTNVDQKPNYGVVSYEIDDELYNKLQRYVRTNFEYNQFGQPVGAEISYRNEVPFDDSRAGRVVYKAMLKMREIVKNQQPVSVVIYDGGAPLVEPEAE